MWLRVDTVGLFPELRRRLLDLLSGLGDDEWELPTACEGWSVFDVAAHLLGVEVGNVSRRRDNHRVNSPPGANLGEWLVGFNEEWVRAARRLSTPVLVDLLAVSGRWFEEYLLTLRDLDARVASVWWAGPEPAPVWLDVAREFTERWIHQQQIREATDRPGISDARFVGPVVATFVHALPHALRSVERPEGACLEVRFEGEGGGVWHLVRLGDDWDLRLGPAPHQDAMVRGSVDTAWRLYANYPAVELAAEGDREVVTAALGARAIIT